MAEFDPDAYLAGTDTGTFDPDAYLAEGAKESFLQKLGQFAAPKIKRVAETLGKADTAIVRSPTFGPLYSAAKESAGTVLGGLVSEEQAGRFTEAAGRRFPKSRTAQVGAAALGTLGQIISPADLILPVVNKLRFLAKAPQSVKVAELANIQAKVEPKVFKAATEALSPAELQAITGTPEKARAATTFVPPQGWKSTAPIGNAPVPTTAGKPFTLQAGLADQNRAALEAFRAKLPQGPATAPRIAQEAALGPKPAIAPTPPIIPSSPEFAGNIRLAKYSPEAQQGILAANKLAGVAERTPSTIAEMKVTGATPAAQELFSVVAKGKSGELSGATQIVRETLEKEAKVFAEQAEVAIKAGGDELDTLLATSPAIKTAEQVSQVAQASGQTLGVFRQTAGTGVGKVAIDTLEKVKAGLRASKSPFAQKKIEAIEKVQRAVSKGDLELAKLPAAYRKALQVTDKVYTLWINAILSNPLTHIRNIGGNTLFLVSKPIEKIMAASVDNVLSAFTGKAPEHTFREVGPMMKGAYQGIKNIVGKGERLPFDASKAGFGKFDRPLQAIPGTVGKIVEFPTKVLEWGDIIGKNMAAQMEYAALKSKGIKGDELIKRSMDEAAYRTYQDEAGKIVKWIMEGRDKVPGFKWVVPFVRTPAKLLERGLERTPLGILKVVGKASKGAYKEAGGQAALASDIGNTVIGSAASAYLALEYGKGNISGGWPTDRREAERWKAEGKKPWSYRTKDGWIALDRIEPFGAVVKTTISTIDTFKNMAGEAIDKKAMAAAANLGKELTRMSAFNGFQNFAQSISDPARFAAKTTSSIASGFVPGAAKFATDYVPGLKDPLMRQKEGAVEMGMAKLPWASERLKPQLDVWGQPIRKEPFFTATSRARESKEIDLLKELDLPVPKYPEKAFGYDFTRDEKFNIHQKAGPIIKNFLSQYSGRQILDSKGAKNEIRAGIDDIKDAVAQLEVLGISFTPNRAQADRLATVINSDNYKKATVEGRRAVLTRMIFGGLK